MQMRARQPMTYNGRNYLAGETFELAETSGEARNAVRRVLTDLGLAEPFSEGVHDDKKRRSYLPKGRYKRRDMQAEE